MWALPSLCLSLFTEGHEPPWQSVWPCSPSLGPRSPPCPKYPAVDAFFSKEGRSGGFCCPALLDPAVVALQRTRVHTTCVPGSPVSTAHTHEHSTCLHARGNMYVATCTCHVEPTEHTPHACAHLLLAQAEPGVPMQVDGGAWKSVNLRLWTLSSYGMSPDPMAVTQH